MKIINLSVTNVKKIKAINYSPTNNVTLVGGNNGEGKSSLLDSIILAIGGRLTKDAEPLRKGTASGKVEIRTEEFVITRNISAKGTTTLVVKSIEGLQYPSPQALLDKFFSTLTFDPLSFASMDTKKQIDTLRKLVGLDFTELDTKRKELFDKRTAVNKDVKSIENQVNAIPLDANCPDKEISVAELSEELEKRTQVNNNQEKLIENHEKEINLLGNLINEIVAIKREIEELGLKLKDRESKLSVERKRLDDQKSLIQSFVKQDVNEIRNKIQNSETINTKVRSNKKRKELESELTTKQAISDELTNEIFQIDSQKEESLRNAKFPISGLSFNENGVTYKDKEGQDILFGQCSSAEKLRVSLAMGMALNPDLRVLLIHDGSLLDEANLNTIKDMAKDNDFQLWIERVGKDKSCQIIIEDGMIKS